jgi:uncharacterized protein (TIGR02145 family)
LSFKTTTCTPVAFDGYDYDVVEIGDQCWFAENLRSTNYADGTQIPGGLDNDAWASATEGAQAIYGEGGADEAQNLSDYGRLYNWYAVDNAAGLCPTGWHVPTLTDFTALILYHGGESVAAGKLKSSPTDTPSWNGTNAYGWSWLPGGYRNLFGAFSSIGSYAFSWSSTSINVNDSAWAIYAIGGSDYTSPSGYNKATGSSVRCLKDSD